MEKHNNPNGYNQFKRKLNEYYEQNGYMIGITSNSNVEFYFDLEDYDLIKNYTWQTSDKGYIISRKNKVLITFHRLVMDAENSKLLVDHINHNKADNRKSNLRLVTSSQNQMNRDKSRQNTSGIRGVYWHKKHKKWQANLQINGKLIYLGLYSNKEDAINARKQAELKYFKEFNYTEG